MKKYDNVAQQFCKFFNSDLLQQIVDNKVDNSQLDRLLTKKVSREEFDKFLQVTDLLDKKIKQISTMQVEIAKTLIPTTAASIYTPQETAQAKIAR